jgi:hypothetical protein
LLIPLLGGSGGGAAAARGGGGGGGAILLASNTRIDFSLGADIRADGGSGAANDSINGGSGGAIRLVAPVIAGTGRLLVQGAGGAAGGGRIRIDTFDRTGASLTFFPPVNTSFGKAMFVFPNPLSRLNIVSAAGQSIPEGTNAPVVVMLPFGSDTNQVIRVQARDFAGVVPINVVITPQNGPRRIFPAEINMASGNPAFTNVNVTIPLNTEAAIHAWTR